LKGYSASVRPPLSVSGQVKRERMKAYGFDAPLSNYELDHLVPLSLGGAPSEVANLWPEALAEPHGAGSKNQLEEYLQKQVCRGRLGLAEAQREIATNWISTYTRYGLNPLSTPPKGDNDDAV
jgi:hypothetical protein